MNDFIPPFIWWCISQQTWKTQVLSINKEMSGDKQEGEGLSKEDGEEVMERERKKYFLIIC